MHMRQTVLKILVALSAALLWGGTLPAHADDTLPNFVKLVKDNRAAVVNIVWIVHWL